MNKTDQFLKESNAIEGVYSESALVHSMIAWQYLISQPKISIEVVLRTHKLLMYGQGLYPNELGYFRKIPVYIGEREGMSWTGIRTYMEEWVKKANEDTRWSDIKLSHVAYEFCHPFVDGNGRTGRMFMNWARIKRGMKIKIIKSSERQKYYKWFN